MISGNRRKTNLPKSVVEIKGSWNALTNTPTLANGTGNLGDIYLVSTDGTFNTVVYESGDLIMYDSNNEWTRISGKAYKTLSSLQDVDLNEPVETNDILTWNGMRWSNASNVNANRVTISEVSPSGPDQAVRKDYCDGISDELAELSTTTRFTMGYVADIDLSSGSAFSLSGGNTVFSLYSQQIRNVPRYDGKFLVYDLSQSLKNIESGILRISRYVRPNDNLFQAPWTNTYRINSRTSFSASGQKKIVWDVTPVEINHTLTVADYACLIEIIDHTGITASISTLTNTDGNISITGTGSSRTLNLQNINVNYLNQTAITNIRGSETNQMAFWTYNYFADGSMSVSGEAGNPGSWRGAIYLRPPHNIIPLNLGLLQTHFFAIQLLGSQWNNRTLANCVIGFANVNAVNNTVGWGDTTLTGPPLAGIYETTTGSARRQRSGRFTSSTTASFNSKVPNNTTETAGTVDVTGAVNTFVTGDILFCYCKTNLRMVIELRNTSAINTVKMRAESPLDTDVISNNIAFDSVVPMFATFDRSTSPDYRILVCSQRYLNNLGFNGQFAGFLSPNAKCMFY